ncbi:MAG: GDSL family lipase [Kordiimonadales bacterium]|nr:MAG: GDSL family lipase [Kordiimonadales bacterium]
MKICFFGDSFTNGTGDDACLGWAGRVSASARARGQDLTYYNLGIRGDTSAEVVGRWHQEAEARINADDKGLLVFSFGTNDCALGEDGRARLPQNDRLKNARAIIVAAPRAWPTLIVGPLPILGDLKANKRIADLSRQMGALSAAHRVPYLDLFKAMKDSDVWAAECEAGDGVHPGAKGYELITEMVENWDAWQMAVAV